MRQTNKVTIQKTNSQANPKRPTRLPQNFCEASPEKVARTLMAPPPKQTSQHQK